MISSGCRPPQKINEIELSTSDQECAIDDLVVCRPLDVVTTAKRSLRLVPRISYRVQCIIC